MAANPRTITDVQATFLSAHENCTVEDKISFYNTWSKLYEQDVKLLDYQAPLLASTCLADVLLEDREQALVLDVACGTGLVAAQLQKLGFCNFHGLDGSEEMLRLAQSKSLYQSLQKCILGAESLPLSSDAVTKAKILEQKRKPVTEMALRNDYPWPYYGFFVEWTILFCYRTFDIYDAVLIVGALSEGQVPYTTIRELHRVTKPGGFVCMTTRSNVSNLLYKTQLQALMEEMEQKLLWVKVKVEEIELWEKATSELESIGDSIYIPGTIYIYQKSRIQN